MQKVITVNLNGHAYQLDESGYDALSRYLEEAARVLRDNPDRAEIVADLEQAIADKCQRFLGAHKSVVAAADVDGILAEMGPIDTEAGTSATTGTADSAGDAAGAGAAAPPKRLFRVPQGAMIAGVCTGLSAYLAIDVALIRIGFVIVALVTKGAGIVAYVAMMFIMPEARTSEDRAAAGGAPFNAKEVVDRAKRQYADGARQLRRQWRAQQRQWRRHGWVPGSPFAAPPPPWVAALLPLFALVHLALFVTMAAMVISLVNTGAIMRWQLPADMPTWAGVLILLVAYQIVVSPIRAAHQWPWALHPAGQPGVYAFWNAVVWLLGLAVVLWIASDHWPEIREFLQRLPELSREFAEAARRLIQNEAR
jgi:phage shock protein PspC (stress-responsive transcriptional regulator)